MGKKDPRIDAYINKSRDFAKPILSHIRVLMHKGCPDVQETIKWGMPHFDYKGTIGGMASFKSHCTLGFWKGNLIKGLPSSILKVGETAMGQFGRITSIKDLPSDEVMLKLIGQAKKLNDEGLKRDTGGKPKERSKNLEIPDYFMNAIRKNKKVQSVFEEFSYTNKKEYVEWVTEAKTEETRNNRLKTAVEWMSEGKIRNWKYLKK